MFTAFVKICHVYRFEVSDLIDLLLILNTNSILLKEIETKWLHSK